MDEPGWAWPAWKFNMKRDDLFTSLHDKYNTITFSLQDSEAFHHDVLELSNQADTADEFHQLLAERKSQRTKEINDCFESLAVEIIANPMLMGTEQWQHALQLFRTKSYDSIVRYFASYIPEELIDEQQCSSPASEMSFSENPSTYTTEPKITDVEDMSQFLDEDDFFPNGPVTAIDSCVDAQAPLSPPHSEAAPSDESDIGSYPSSGRSSRSASFSASESGRLSGLLRDLAKDDDDTASQSDSGETVLTSVCDSVETVSSIDSSEHYNDAHSMPMTPHDDEDWDINNLPIQYSEDELDDTLTYDTLDSETATPKPLPENATNYLEHPRKATAIRALSIRRSQSPKSYIRNRTSTTLSRANSRRSPEEVFSKIQKSPAEAARRRPRGRMGLD
ncbi:hypothetical protein LEL_00850 [Akanthomyces lecanii RCEF 1005]|uniref:Uncharacterized protein n=1 Tax=Akanthomyces lecanii RCEF 1005 TaxID=1081108 RepID=A0A168K744_CORDF|nr:hypothetical protein LEL_00850 [Akanthomyces lecanii RCEF 1005]